MAADPLYERISIHTKEPLMFFNTRGGAPVPPACSGSTPRTPTASPAQIPRVIVPRRLIPHIADKPVEVDVRSFGVRMPPATQRQPELRHHGPDAASSRRPWPGSGGWWPRGASTTPASAAAPNWPSEGVGSYWPFATGKRVKPGQPPAGADSHAARTPGTCSSPTSTSGAYQVGFAAEWIAREYLARRGGVNMKMDRLGPRRAARSSATR